MPEQVFFFSAFVLAEKARNKNQAPAFKLLRAHVTRTSQPGTRMIFQLDDGPGDDSRRMEAFKKKRKIKVEVEAARRAEKRLIPGRAGRNRRFAETFNVNLQNPFTLGKCCLLGDQSF